VKSRRLLFLSPLVALALLGLACSQAEKHPDPLGDCLDPVKCNPPTGDGGGTKDAATDAKPSDAKADVSADAGDASDAASDADAAKDGDAG